MCENIHLSKMRPRWRFTETHYKHTHIQTQQETTQKTVFQKFLAYQIICELISDIFYYCQTNNISLRMNQKQYRQRQADVLPLQFWIRACWTAESTRPPGRSLRYFLSKLATVDESDSESRSTSSPLSSRSLRVSTARTFPFILNKPS